MSRRNSWIAVGFALGLGILLGCGKKPIAPNPEFEKPDEPMPSFSTADIVNTDHVLYAHVNVRAIRSGTLFTELKQAIDKNGVSKMWTIFEAEAKLEYGISPFDVDSITAVVTEVTPRDDPRFMLIVESSKPIDREAFGAEPKGKPDSRGFYKFGRLLLLHYPDDRTAVLLHPDLAQKYLDGYAKDRNGWPLTADLTKAAAAHTAIAIGNVRKLPQDLAKEVPEKFRPLLAAKSVMLAADVKWKVISVDGQATFPNGAAAEKAKESIKGLIDMAAAEIESLTKRDPSRSRDLIAFDAFKPALEEAYRAVKEARVGVDGSDVALAITLSANFDLDKMVAAAVKQMREDAPRSKAELNLKQLMLSFMNYNDSIGKVPVLGVGKGGMPLKTANEKPLLSWRVAILPYMEQGPLYQQFKLDEPWDSAHNKKLIEKMPDVFKPVKQPGKPGYTHIQMVVGPSAMRLPNANYPASIQDGLANTIALVEAAEPVIWTKPDDVMFPGKELPKDFRKKFGGQFPGGFYVAMWDGTVRFVSDKVSDLTLGRALDPKDGQPLGPDW